MASSLTTLNSTWATPKTWSTGEALTATLMNQYMRDIQTALKDQAGWLSILDETTADFSTSSTSFVAISASYLTATITTGGGDILAGFSGQWWHSTTSIGALDILVDGVQMAGEDGLIYMNLSGTNTFNCSFTTRITGLSAGSHSFALAWKTGAATLTMRSGFTTVLSHPRFWGMEIGAV